MKFATLFSIIFLLVYGCTTSISDSYPETGNISLNLNVNSESTTRSIPDVGTAVHSVNRILILPFQKKEENGSNTDAANFIPAWNFIQQYDVDNFPATALTVKLIKSLTYKVAIIGFNRNDYNYQQPNASTNRFDLYAQPTGVSLANFRLYPKAANEVPEFFTCICTVSNGTSTPDTTFIPNDGTNINLTGTLKRAISGLGVYLTNIPAYVTSITLSAENLVKASRFKDNLPDLVQLPNDGASRIIRQQTPQAGQIRFNEFLLPTGTTAKTAFYLDVAYDTRTTRYKIIIPDSEVSVSNQIILQPNGAVRITGNFTSTGISFQLNYTINLDDNLWDGLQ